MAIRTENERKKEMRGLVTKANGMEIWQKIAVAAGVVMAVVQTVRMWQGIYKKLTR